MIISPWCCTLLFLWPYKVIVHVRVFTFPLQEMYFNRILAFKIWDPDYMSFFWLSLWRSKVSIFKQAVSGLANAVVITISSLIKFYTQFLLSSKRLIILDLMFMLHRYSLLIWFIMVSSRRLAFGAVASCIYRLVLLALLVFSRMFYFLL